ncbi:MAG: hypothetical protein QNI91_04665 [Arenicellales bacterium]|nr:hypothetical protein [Arenicellales bacterium]
MRATSLRPYFLSIVLLTSSVHAQSDDQQVQQTMRQAFDAIAYLLPLSLRAEQDMSADDKALVERHLDVLTSSDKELAKHAESRDPEFKLLARSFDRAIERVSSAFQDESYIDAYFSLFDMAQNCVSCHSRLPDDSDFLLGQKLFARMDTSELDPEEIAQLYVATRQFDSALNKYEEIILDDSVNPFDLDLDGVLIEYLRIGLTVTQDFERVRSTLDKFLERDDVPLYIQHHVGVWQNSMSELGDNLNIEPSLDRARDVFNQATALTIAPAGRERAIHDIVASSELRQLVGSSDKVDPEALSEAYYLLGVITLRTLRPKPAVPEMEFLLESAIRAAPKGPHAMPAYLLLEEFSYTNFLGDPTTDIRELHELIKK